MNPSVLDDSAISLNMGVVHWHTHLINLSRIVEDGWLIHIVPGTVKVICSLKVLAKVKRLPKLCCVGI